MANDATGFEADIKPMFREIDRQAGRPLPTVGRKRQAAVTAEEGSREGLLARIVAAVLGMGVEHPVRVGIDGSDAAGKTTLADE